MTAPSRFAEDATGVEIAGAAQSKLEFVTRDARSDLAAVPGGWICRCWGEPPYWQRWNGTKDALRLRGTYFTEAEARA